MLESCFKDALKSMGGYAIPGATCLPQHIQHLKFLSDRSLTEHMYNNFDGCDVQSLVCLNDMITLSEWCQWELIFEKYWFARL